MNARQRILTALNNGQPDRVPILDTFQEPVILDLAAHLGLRNEGSHRGQAILSGEESLESLDLMCLLMKELGVEATWYSHSDDLDFIDETHVKDKYDRVYEISRHGMPMIVKGPIDEPADTRGYNMAARLSLDDFANVQHLMEQLGQEGMVVMGITDPFRESWYLRGGMERYLMDMYLNPDLVHALAHIVTDYLLTAIDLGTQLGAEVVAMDGDLAGETTTMISPKHYREFVKPYQKQVVDYAHGKGLKILKHTDGNAWSILDDFVEIGFDGFHPVQPQCMDIAEVKTHLGGKMCIIGNIDCRDLLPSGTPQEVEATVKETIGIAAPGGSYILGSSNALHVDCKTENILAMIDATHRYGVYPLFQSVPPPAGRTKIRQ